MHRPLVTVLLATHNGELWLTEQLDSLFGQFGVEVKVVSSDDRSTDATRELLLDWAGRAALRCLPTDDDTLGNANRNFMRLIRRAPIGDAQFIALSDQDDIWHSNKLLRAITCVEEMALDAYSSDVTAFWNDGREVLIRKSQPQRRHDYLFESAGPGCTFVFRRAAFERLRGWVTAHQATLNKSPVHDWVIYAYARSCGWRWHIDTQANVLYRQHDRNEIGANAGFKAAMKRWSQIRNGKFRDNVLAIAHAVDDRSRVTQWLERLSLMDRFRLLASASQCRRQRSERLLLAIFFLFMGRSEK